MSEFKYACPVCGQHIKCDSSQAGTQMQCPTCFQQITVPQAPAAEGQKFILTGTKKSERPVPKAPDENLVSDAGKRSLLPALVSLLVCLAVAGTTVFAFRGQIANFFRSFHNDHTASSESPKTEAVSSGPIAPPANDTNWMLSLDAAVTPDTPVTGRIHGHDFILERAVYQKGTLTLREGKSGPLDLAVQINFSGAEPEALAGQTLNIATNAPAAARVTMFWKNDSQVAKESIQGGYAMRLTFGQVSGNRLPGEIYLCTPDEQKSYLAGNFNAQIRRPKPRTQ